MDQQELDETRRFLASVGRSTLFEYLELSEDADDDAVEAALRLRRGWAQAQQSNAKFRHEAVWVLRYASLCRRLLTSERDAYRAALRREQGQRQLEALRLFVLGTLADGVLTERGEDAIFARGEGLGLERADISELIERALAECGGCREEEGTVDPLVVLGVTGDASTEEIRAAYDARYHLARQLKDPRAASRRYEQLDAAWEALRDPTRRDLPDAIVEAPALLPPEPGAPSLSFADAPADPAPPTPTPRRPLPRPPTELEIAGPQVRRVRARKRPVTLPLEVRRRGSGSARVFTDREWVTVVPETLDPHADTQQVEVTIHPLQMPRRKAVSLVTVLASDQARVSVTLEVERTTRRGWLLLAMIAGTIAAVIGLRPTSAPPAPPPPSPTLAVAVDPPAGEISVDGKLVSTRGRADLSAELPTDRPVEIAVSLEGFAPWSQTVQLAAGAHSEVQATLELRDPMDYAPTEEHLRGDVDLDEVSNRLRARRDGLHNCLQRNINEPEGFTAVLDLTGYISPSGHVFGVDLSQRNFESAAALLCVKRQLRAIRMPMIAGDYAMFHHGLTITVPSSPSDSLSPERGGG